MIKLMMGITGRAYNGVKEFLFDRYIQNISQKYGLIMRQACVRAVGRRNQWSM